MNINSFSSCRRTAGPPAMEGITMIAAQRRSAIDMAQNRRFKACKFQCPTPNRKRMSRSNPKSHANVNIQSQIIADPAYLRQRPKYRHQRPTYRHQRPRYRHQRPKLRHQRPKYLHCRPKYRHHRPNYRHHHRFWPIPC